MDIKNNTFLLIEWDTNNNLISVTVHPYKKSAEYLSLVDDMENFKIIEIKDILEYSDHHKIIFKQGAF